MEKKGKPSTRAKNKYNAKNYDSLRIVVPKGQKQAIEAHVSERKDSVNGYVNRLIRSDMGLTEAEWRSPKTDE